MGFVKVVKTRAYFKRFQVKFRRRREGKTDYYARQRLIFQDKNKYNSPKYRFVVRQSNRFITTQVSYATIKGDVVVCAAYSKELPRYGVKVGLNNYAAAYATGLLCARRLLTKFGLAEKYAGNDNIDGEYYNIGDEETEGAQTFNANLDVGIKATTTGAKVFGALKGAVDGGLNVPHSESRFPGYDRDEKVYEAEVHKNYIFGKTIADYQESLKADEPEKYKKLFSKYIAAGVAPNQIEDMYKNAHAAIRKDPTHKATTKKVPAKQTRFYKVRPVKHSLAQRRDSLKQRVAHLMKNQ